jgi:quercetin dioxygenase-like cupin family protein
MSAYSHPHTIQDGNGSTLTFERIEGQGDDERLIVTNVVAPGAGPPMHVHHLQNEGLTVQSGRLGYQVAGRPEGTAGPGETVEFAAGVAHRFWNCGQDELRCSGYISPPNNVEYFLTQIYESARRNGGKRPRAFDGAWLLRRYRSEFAMPEIPAPVQRLVFPVQVAIGRLLGWHRRFDGSPKPVRAGAR